MAQIEWRVAVMAAMAVLGDGAQTGAPAQIGPRPFYLVDTMKPGPAKDRLAACGPDRAYMARDFSVRPAHDHRHPGAARTRREVQRGLPTGGPRGGPKGAGQVLHERSHAGRVQDAERQDRRRRCVGEDGCRLHERDAALAH
jgi:hypothetical protein